MTAGTDDLERRTYELSIINSIARALNQSVDLRGALQLTLASVAQLLELETGWIWLLNEETDNAYLAAAQNLPPALARNPARMEGSCHCLDTFRSGDLEGAANVNVVGCSRLWNLVDGTDGLRYHASIPLYAHDKQLGVLNAASKDWRELDEDELRLLYTIGDLLSIAIERARLFDQSRQVGAISERNRIAREIHDTLAQGLSAITLQLEAADALLESGGRTEALQQALRSALQLSRSNLDEARRSVMGLRAAPLEGRTLAQALRELVDKFEEVEAAQVDFDAIGGHHPLSLAVEAGLYRVAQEALNNVREHAQADHVRVDLVITPPTIELRIEDNGRGFDRCSVERNRYGITGMNERVNLLGGELHVESAPGAGTRVRVMVPFSAS